jgi:hypothetical protein
MPSPLDVAEELQTYLVAQRVGVLPAGRDGTTPIVILAPRDGAPQPQKDGSGAFGSAATITILTILAARPNALDFAIDETFIDLIVRARTNGAAKLILRQIRGLLNPGDAVGGKKMWRMGAINPVECCLPWRGAQPIGQDANSYDWSESYMFQIRRRILDGYTTY